MRSRLIASSTASCSQRGIRRSLLVKSTVEHGFGTLKGWMGASLTRDLKTTAAEMSLHVLAYNRKRVITILGVQRLLAGIRL